MVAKFLRFFFFSFPFSFFSFLQSFIKRERQADLENTETRVLSGTVERGWYISTGGKDSSGGNSFTSKLIRVVNNREEFSVAFIRESLVGQASV